MVIEMIFEPYVSDANGNKVSVAIMPMSRADAQKTNTSPKWQTSWTSDYISDKRLDKYSVKIGERLIALGAYEISPSEVIVHITYIEASPESNPVFVGNNREYYSIGKLLIAYGIKLSIDYGFGGDVELNAKTTKLAEHYEKDFGAVRLPSVPGIAPRYLIADDAAKAIFLSYLI